MNSRELLQLASDNLEYRDGGLFWKKSPARNVKAGDRAGTLNPNGYRYFRVEGKPIAEHRMVYFMHNPDWDISDSSQEIDHINRIPDDNRIENLRVVTKQENQFNRIVKGYCWDKQAQKWKASISVNGKDIFLGNFDYETDARLARVTAKKKYHIIEERA